jgi:hypothetical protein
MFFDIRQTLEKALANYSKEARQATHCPLVFAHVCLGSLTPSAKSPYDGLRITEIAATKSERTPIGRMVVDSQGHRSAFRHHINLFGRSATFLDWLTRRLYRDLATLRSNVAVPTSHIEVLVCSQNAALTLNGNTLKLSSSFFDTIVKANVVRRYFTELYKQGSGHDGLVPAGAAVPYMAERFVSLRFAAESLLLANGVTAALKRLSALYKDKPGGTQDQESEWEFLGALQTALMYVWASQNPSDEPVGFVTVGACYRINRVAVDKCPLGLFSAVLPPRCDDARRNEIVRSLKELLKEKMPLHINDAKYYHDRGDTPQVHHRTTKSWTPSRIQAAVNKELRNAFPTRWFQRWRASLMVWLSYLAEHLRGKVHEGQPLNFSFVVADRTEIHDSGLFEVVPLQIDGHAKLVPLDDEGNADDKGAADDLLDRVLREIEKKNYSWFLGGKYALLWDASFPSRYPQYLIRFKESSWEVFQNQIRLGKKTRAADVVRAMIFVSTDGSGGMVLSGKQVVSFRKGQAWSEESSRRETRLKRYLQRHIGRWNFAPKLKHDTVKRIADALLAISDDSHAGCMLVIFEKDKRLKFECMGEIWKTSFGGQLREMSRDVLTSLMAMDGATCLFVKNGRPHVEFRRLATAPDKATRTLHIESRIKLDGAGSRKWSAANAAKRHEIAIVISVSQDGPVHIYEAKDGKVEIHEL